MASQRTILPVDEKMPDEKLIAAIRESVVLHGVRRTTANDIAERAGISRMTFYRRMGSVENAVLAALTQEFRAYTSTVQTGTPAGTGRQQLVHFAVESVRVFATSDLLGSIAERDPEFLIPYVTDRLGASQQLILDQLHELLDSGVRDGSIESAEGTATMLLLAVQGLALSCRVLFRMGAFEESLTELTKMLERYLTPSNVTGEGSQS
ncbi:MULTISPECIES: TetR/AcrR family transcriptional regulator [Arthrobacter]|uniref:TetR family transcriptional regulator n=1 Tax=Arthrobacter psychrochitiniphilus TaxID=291045 RepID=A0A2V3DT56_9MICC|nr:MULTISPECIES: TetR/AcrR family transcriptional regulator [Arthrobacter]NYG18898.1 AcrR family transcriptional regulator [Arthrobacter psychrochitiniphilus]PXA66200.1 TetR family transcriptional regulator [Arthrobacter psychrochitiniphilus]